MADKPEVMSIQQQIRVEAIRTARQVLANTTAFAGNVNQWPPDDLIKIANWIVEGNQQAIDDLTGRFDPVAEYWHEDGKPEPESVEPVEAVGDDGVFEG